MKRFFVFTVVFFITMSLFSAEKVSSEKKKSTINFKWTTNKTIALSMTAGGGAFLLVGAGLIGGGAYLVDYFLKGSDVVKWEYGLPKEYYWDKDGTKGAKDLYWFPGVGLLIAGGVTAVLSAAVMLASIYFWLADSIKDDKNRKIGFFIEPGLSVRCGFNILL